MALACAATAHGNTAESDRQDGARNPAQCHAPAFTRTRTRISVNPGQLWGDVCTVGHCLRCHGILPALNNAGRNPNARLQTARNDHVFAALDVKSGMVIGKCLPRHRTKAFPQFRSNIDKVVLAKFDRSVLCKDHVKTHQGRQIFQRH